MLFEYYISHLRESFVYFLLTIYLLNIYEESTVYSASTMYQ